MYFALAFLWMGEAPAIGVGSVAVAAIVAIGFAQVELADAADAVAGVAQPLIVGSGARGQPPRIVQAAETARLQARGQTDPSWRADGCVGGALGEAHASGGEAVEVRRPQEVGTGCAEIVVAVLIIHDEEDIGTGHWRVPWRCYGRLVA